MYVYLIIDYGIMEASLKYRSKKKIYLIAQNKNFVQLGVGNFTKK